MKAYWRSGGIAPRILDLGSRWRWVVSFTPRPLYSQGKSSRYPLDRKLNGPQSWSGKVVKRQSTTSFGTRTPGHPARSPALYHWSISAAGINLLRFSCFLLGAVDSIFVMENVYRALEICKPSDEICGMHNGLQYYVYRLGFLQPPGGLWIPDVDWGNCEECWQRSVTRQHDIKVRRVSSPLNSIR
jgi:hypothetical protein